MFNLPDFNELKLAALNATASSVVITDSVGTILWVNPAFTHLTGYSESDAVGKNPRILKSGQNQNQIYQQLWQTVKSGEVWTGQLINRKKNGDLYHEEQTITPIKTKGLVTHFIAVKQDISQRVETETEIRQLNTFLDLIVENLPNMVFVKKASDLTFVRFNKAGEELLGLSRDTLMGKSDFDFFPKEQAEKFTSFDHQVLTGKKVVDIPEEPINTKHFGTRILHTKKVPILDSNGNPQFLLGISEDITEARKASQALQEKIDELQRTNELMVNRELRMIELKEKLAKYAPNS